MATNEELRELHEAATPGPWRVLKDALDPPEHWIVAGGGLFGSAQIAGPSEAMLDNPDFELVVAMRNELPRLLAEKAELTKELESGVSINQDLMTEVEMSNSYIKELLADRDQLAALLEMAVAAAITILDGFEKGIFLRNVYHDNEPDWGLKIAHYIEALAALDKIKESNS